MNNLDKLLTKAEIEKARLQIRFNPSDRNERFGIKWYPDEYSDDHFYSYHDNLDNAARLLLNELTEHFKW